MNSEFNSKFKIQNSKFVLAILFIVAVICTTGGFASAGDLVIHLPAGIIGKSAEAIGPSSKAGDEGPILPGKSAGNGAFAFAKLASGTPYDLRLTLADGRVLHGVNMAWYTRESARVDAGPLDEGDRHQINALVADVKSFYDVSRIVAINGDHDRATVLVERMRDSRFHGGASGEVIWRMELWYFNNDFGGWSEPPQTNKVLIRTRFATSAEFHAAVDNLKWIPILGGIQLTKPDEHREMTIPPEAIAAPTTQP